MSEIIKLTDTVRIRRANSLNLIVEILTNDDESGTEKWREANGSGRGPFCTTEVDACIWVLKHGLLDEGGETDLKEAVSRYEKATKQLARNVAAAMESR